MSVECAIEVLVFLSVFVDDGVDVVGLVIMDDYGCFECFGR